MTPYYADDLVTIYCCDWRDWPPTAVGAIVTDPPYGRDWRQHGGGRTGKSRGMRRYHGITNDTDTGERDALLAAMPTVPAALFGSFYAPFPVGVRQVLVYQKTPDAGLVGSTTGYRRDAEPIFLVGPWPVREAHSSSVLASRISLQTLAKPGHHPHAKPVDVLGALITAAPPGAILDPFAGSGSTLVAAKLLGRRAVGIEIEERWCEAAANRVRQDVLGLSA